VDLDQVSPLAWWCTSSFICTIYHQLWCPAFTIHAISSRYCL